MTDTSLPIPRLRAFHVCPSLSNGGTHEVVLGVGSSSDGSRWFYVSPAMALKLATQLMAYAVDHAANECPVLESFRRARARVRAGADLNAAANEFGVDPEMLAAWMSGVAAATARAEAPAPHD